MLAPEHLPNINLIDILKNRRQRLGDRIDFPAILWAGSASPRNFSANTFPFRASSHFLYFAGLPIPHAAIHLQAGKLTLFVEDPHPSSTLWYGQRPNREELAAQIGADAAYPLSELPQYTPGAATIAVQDAATWTQQTQICDRYILPQIPPQGIDLELAQAIVEIRLTHDAGALVELRKAATVSIQAHLAGMKAVRKAQWEAQVRAAIEAVIIAENMTTAYPSIVTVHGEILHNDSYGRQIQSGDLLLADVGAESNLGWAADITRTYPVSGQFSPTQRDIYDIVLAAHDACIAAVKPGVEYEDIHLLACRILAEGLVDLGILRGHPEELVEKDIHALFFPHGIGHLLGLDVHDMEDLGDLSGYEPGRSRSTRFGLGYLRLNRVLRPGMLVTIEPGFYQIPAILHSAREQYQYLIDWERLAQFRDVRGIRIEDDVLVTATGHEVLTQDLPTKTSDLEELVNSGGF